jgi:hypothetical protein
MSLTLFVGVWQFGNGIDLRKTKVDFNIFDLGC